MFDGHKDVGAIGHTLLPSRFPSEWKLSNHCVPVLYLGFLGFRSSCKQTGMHYEKIGELTDSL